MAAVFKRCPEEASEESGLVPGTTRMSGQPPRSEEPGNTPRALGSAPILAVFLAILVPGLSGCTEETTSTSDACVCDCVDTPIEEPETGPGSGSGPYTDPDTLLPVTVTAGTMSHIITALDLGLDFVEVTAGASSMGCTEGQGPTCRGDEWPVHSVVLTRPFLISVTEVTQAQYEAVTGEQPAAEADCGPDCAVETVSWHDSAAFTNALNDLEDREHCYICTDEDRPECVPVDDIQSCPGYRLPTESEWEAAARCGTNFRYAGSDDDREVAWTSHSALSTVHPVGLLLPNACGLYDMSGNVWEWVGDWKGIYPEENVTDPTGPEEGTTRVYRGGGWGNRHTHSRVASRWNRVPHFEFGLLGIRVVRTLP